LTTALELDPGHWQSLDQLTDLKSAADLELAEAGYRRLIAAEADDGSLHRKLAVNLGHQLRIPEAIKSYRTALNLNAADDKSLIGLGLVLLNLGQADESLVLFLQALALDPDNADALACNGLALHTLGDQPQAIEMLVALANAQVTPVSALTQQDNPSVPVPASQDQGDEMFESWRKALLAGGFQPPDQYQAPALGGALTVAGLYKSTRTAVVLAKLSHERTAALVDKGYTVIDMSDPVQWGLQFSQHTLVFGAKS
jgi:tetratricopeptide (TPR) repeat protein